MADFVAYTNALDLIRALAPIVQQLKAHSSEAADQLERAASSIVQNVAEGSKRIGRDPKRFYAMASGSAAEVKAVLDLAGAWGWPVDDRLARELLDREQRLLTGLTRPRRSVTS